MKPNRKARILTVVFGSAVVLGLSAAVLHQGNLAKTYRRQLEYSYQEALGQLAESTAALAVDLEKACYTTDQTALWQTSARLWRECGTAKAALSALPVRQQGLADTSGFLSQVGDYAMALARQAGNADPTPLTQLLPYAQTLAQQTDALEAAVLSGELPVDSLAFGYLEQQPTTANEEAAAASATVESSHTPTEPGGSAGETAYAAMEEGFAGLPRLVYDGPFSSHLQGQSSKMLANQGHLSRSRAQEAAAAALGVPPAALQEMGDENGAIPCYLFGLGEKTAAVTKQGGYLLYLTDSRLPAGQAIGLEEAKKAARQKLEELGYRNMESSYHEVANNIAVFHFAALQDGVVCYTDLVKVGVALDNGEVVQLDGRGYLMNHHNRTLPAAALDPQTAQQMLSPALAAQSHRLALIPSAGRQERLCHEFLCRGSGDRQVLVYLNAATGQQEDLLLLEIDSSGTLTV